ncbi:MAG: RnfABCDGE type electron transport complex subunit D [Proteobacteria bacterium]|nr:RnfABCDGE type electron transport complex subunit D [Pseudomonadota bacterium]
MKTPAIMLNTLAALVPGTLAFCWFFGAGVLLNILIATAAAVVAEALALRLRDRSLASLRDGSIILTGALLGLCLPPLLPGWMVLLGAVAAVVFGKQVYGGTGQNVFNPAMVGYCVLILSFPLAMSQWPDSGNTASWRATLDAKLTLGGYPAYDGLTAATPLDSYRFREGQTNQEFFARELGNGENWQRWATVNLAFLVGGAYLLYRRIIPWQTPAAMLGTLGLLSLLFYAGGSSDSLGSPVFHLLGGATMLGAFFIITDPVTCPGYPRALLCFGAGIGLVTFVIRSIGAYPEGLAFSVLLLNACAPMLDHLFTRRAPA